MINFNDYVNKYRFIKFERNNGVLEIRIHKDDGCASWSAYPKGLHEELGDAFYQVGRDPENRVVILTGTGDRFLTEMDFSEPDPDGLSPQFWDRIYKEGKDLLTNLLDIEVPVIAAVNGPAFIHAELLTLSDIVIASDTAVFADKAHAVNGVVPGDGVHTWWQMLLGPNRGRHFLLTGQEISADEGKQLGFVAEVVSPQQLMDRTREIAAELASKPPLMLRYTRVAGVQHIKRRMLDELGYGLMLEGMAMLGSLPKSE
jgi:enoyl-CoA hydratase/carnithine racemase